MSRWRWSQLQLEDLQQAGRRGELWSSQAGWIWAAREDRRIRVGWLECGPDDGMDMLRSIVDLATESNTDQVQITVPAVPWLVRALESLQFSLAEMLILERPN